MPHSRPRETAQFKKAAGQLGPYTKAARRGKRNLQNIGVDMTVSVAVLPNSLPNG